MRLLAAPQVRRSTIKIVVVALGIVFLAMLAASLRTGSPKSAVVALVVAAMPLLIYVASRWPIVFPFGLYVFLVPFDPLLAYVSGGGTLTKLVGIGAIGALALRALLTRRVLLPPSSWFAWGGFVLLMTLSMVWSVNVDSTIRPLQIVASLFAFFTVIAIYPISFAEFRALRAMVITAGVGTALYGSYAFHSTQLPQDPLNKHADRLILSIGNIHMDPNHYGAFFLIPLGFVVAGLLLDPRPIVKVAYAGMFAIMAAEIALTGSRGAFISMAVLVLYLGIRSKRYVTTIGVTIVGLLVSLAIPRVWERFADKTQGDNSGRNEIWSTGLRAFHDYWLTGSGFGTFIDSYNKYLLRSTQREFQGWDRPAHNLPISIGVELGIVGLAVLGYTIWATARQNATIPRTHPLYEDRIAIEASLLALLTIAMTIDVLWYKYIWLALSINILLANVYQPHAFRSPATDIVTRVPSDSRARARAVRARVRF